ncbi:hypothetical protein [Halobacillus yeomjeoni]|uniref:Lipoprotein n=1 Tax=Halobacillus yeomjeoni TaxID=311194 RepID=A0A931HUF7_9BACI|nr:hypothetical protein [Halobacillus yeomjeoni]MBH0229735.1 hypothetical protein [Halobacillus yeomjeoni]
MKYIIPLLLFILLAMTGCQQTGEVKGQQTLKNNEALLFESNKYGLSISKDSGWQLIDEKNEERLNLKLSNGTSYSIISAVSTEKNFSKIKKELLYGAGDVEIIKDSKHQISFETKMKNKIRTDIHLSQNEEFTYVVTFVTSLKDYDEERKDMEKLLDHISYD